MSEMDIERLKTILQESDYVHAGKWTGEAVDIEGLIDVALETLAAQEKRIAELTAERDQKVCTDCGGYQSDDEREFDKDCPCGGGYWTQKGAITFLLMERNRLTAQVERMRETGEALRDYLNKGTWPNFDIPDEIYGPFVDALDEKPEIAQAALEADHER